MPQPAAAIYDLDGSVVDNMHLHAEAFGVFASRHGLPALTAADRVKLDGRRNSEIFPILFGRPMQRDEWLAYEDEKEGLYRDLSRGRMAPLPGLVRLLDLLAQLEVPVALATSAPAANVAHTLAEIDLAGRFPIIVRGDQVGRGKPAPDVFLEAARQLRVAAAGCLVFEDAPMGITAAHAAGMPCVALTTSFSAVHLAALPEPPEAAFPDFESFLELCTRDWVVAARA